MRFGYQAPVFERPEARKVSCSGPALCHRVLPVITTTAGRASWHCAAGRAAAHGEHRGSGYCLTSLRQRVAHRGIAPQGGWQPVESMRQWVLPVVTWAADQARGRTSWHRAGAGRATAHGTHEAVGTACNRHDSRSQVVASRRRESMGQWILPVVTTTAGRTSGHRAGAGRAAAHGGHRGSGYCLSSLRQQIVHRGIAPLGGRRRV